jgi:hypothetical protein
VIQSPMRVSNNARRDVRHSIYIRCWLCRIRKITINSATRVLSRRLGGS